MKLAAAYIRVSTDDQLEYSPESQLKLIKEYASQNDYFLPPENVYTDGGISGATAEKRPAFQAMIAAAKEEPPPFEIILVWKYSRFARNQEEAIVYKNLLKKHGIEVHSLTEPSSDSPFSGLVERVIEWMDEYYLINLAGEVRRGMTEKASRGEAMGKAPLGYKVKNKQYVLDPEHAETVKRIFDLFDAGITIQMIARKLLADGVKSRVGKAIPAYTVRYILQNPFYVGKIRWSPNETDHTNYRKPKYVFELPSVDKMQTGPWEPLISLEQWERVQDKLKRRAEAVKAPRSTLGPYLLRGLVRCSDCGGLFCRIVKKGISRYQCANYSRGQCSTCNSVRMDVLDNAVIQEISRLAISREIDVEPLSPLQMEDNTSKIKAEQARILRAKAAYLNGAFTVEEYKAIKTASEKKIAELQKPPEKIDMTKNVLNVVDFLKNSSDVEAKNAALLSIIDKIVFDKAADTLDIYFLP